VGEWIFNFTILDLGTRWRRVFSVTLLQIYFSGKSPQYPLYRRLDRPQNRSGRFGIKKKPMPLSGIELWMSSP
jgi:hypothetical protein